MRHLRCARVEPLNIRSRDAMATVVRAWTLAAIALVARTLLLAAVAFVGVLLSDSVARASVTDISVKSVKNLGSFAGKPYREAAIQVSGTAAGGAYSVPAVLAYPSRRSDANGFALVDPYNTVLYQVEGWPGGPFLVPEARRFLGDEYTFGRGNVYIAVLWDKSVLEKLDVGFIAAAIDAYDVLRDTAALVRTPKSMPYPRRFHRPPAASRVVAAGYSASADLLRNFYTTHENTAEGLTFDGALLAASQASCVSPDWTTYYLCPGVVADGGKMLTVNSQADVEFAGFLGRGQTSDYRVLELAGTAHIPVPLFDFRKLGNPHQNPISNSPALRAAHANLLRWIKGTPAPTAPNITLQDVEPVDLGGFPYIPSAHDSDGNAIGGVRLPHMTSVVHGKPAGAPLGTYEGLNFNTDNPFLIASGTFFPFSQARLNELYPTHRAYVHRVRRAADQLLQERLILNSDRGEYVRAAKRDH